MSNPVQDIFIDRDLFYSIEDSDGPITLTLKLKNMEEDNHIFFKETKSVIGIPLPTGRQLLTKVIELEKYKEPDIYFITVKRM